MTPDNFKLINYAVYTVATAAVTVWVGRSLFRNGRPFVIEAFDGDAGMADSVNHLLLVGFHLVSFGGLALLLKLEAPPADWNGLVEALAFKLGAAFTGLGAMHFFNLYNFDRLRTRCLNRRAFAAAEAARLAREEAEKARLAEHRAKNAGLAAPAETTPPPLPIV